MYLFISPCFAETYRTPDIGEGGCIDRVLQTVLSDRKLEASSFVLIHCYYPFTCYYSSLREQVVKWHCSVSVQILGSEIRATLGFLRAFCWEDCKSSKTSSSSSVVSF